MATTPSKLMTFEEFETLPNHPHGLHYELRCGEPILAPPRIHKHYRIQLAMMRLLERAAGDTGEVSMEMGFRPMGDRDYRIADVVYLAKDRWDGIDRYLMVSPELVIEILSPSNTRAELREKRELCLKTGSREFWAVDADLRQIEVSVHGGASVIYKSGQEIPLFFVKSPGGKLAVDEIFS